MDEQQELRINILKALISKCEGEIFKLGFQLCCLKRNLVKLNEVLETAKAGAPVNEVLEAMKKDAIKP